MEKSPTIHYAGVSYFTGGEDNGYITKLKPTPMDRINESLSNTGKKIFLVQEKQAHRKRGSEKKSKIGELSPSVSDNARHKHQGG